MTLRLSVSGLIGNFSVVFNNSVAENFLIRSIGNQFYAHTTIHGIAFHYVGGIVSDVAVESTKGEEIVDTGERYQFH